MSPGVGTSACLLTFLFSAAALAEETLLQCRKIAGDGDRLACYDRVIDRLDGASTRPEQAPGGSTQAAASEPSGDSPQAQKRSDGLFGRSAATSERALRETLGVERATSQPGVVAAVRRLPDRHLEITLESGQVWRQADSERVHVRAGDSVEIEAGALGAYYLRSSSGGRSVRVKRLE